MQNLIQTTSACLAVATILIQASFARADDAPAEPNLNRFATASTSFVTGHESLTAIQTDRQPRNSFDHDHGCYGNWPERGTQWVQYEWDRPVSLDGVEVYWWDDHQGVRLPSAARLTYWNGHAFVPTNGPAIGVEKDRFNTARFDAVETTKLRLEIDGQGDFATGIIAWRVNDTGKSPGFPPIVLAGPDRVAVMPAPTYLRGSGLSRPAKPVTSRWTKTSGPGDVTFATPDAAETSATFSAPGDYVLGFTYGRPDQTATDTVAVRVEPKSAIEPQHAVYASSYKIDSAFWRDRLKNLIVNWIPHCVAMCDKSDLAEGGITNLIEAGKKLRGEPAKPHVGYPFSNAWVLNTAESMAVALTLDAQGDAEVLAAQAGFRKKLDEWIPIILAAQEPDGYFQTRFTLGSAREQKNSTRPVRWDGRTRGDHEGYVGGYFIEMGIAHLIATQGQDRRLYDAAVKLADCWVDHIGPAPKQNWYDGHQEMEQALVRLGRFVNDTDGVGRGQKYIDLAKFLLDCRGLDKHATTRPAGGDFYTGPAGGSEYDQSHAPVTHQYQAVGHAVRAAYTYSAMADITAETRDPAYQSATMSIWDNIVARKYYVTGGIGSGETSEGFGPDYSLPNHSAYVESCSSCGLLYMQYKLNLATHQAKYADLYETTLYNAILGSVDLPAKNFTYTNALDSSEKRYGWHVCPCCVGNIPRVLLMLPTWMYAKNNDRVYMNLFAGSTVDVGRVGGTDLRIVQKTDYPWKGDVAVIVEPKTAAEFTLFVRSPKRAVSPLYTAAPVADGILWIKVNGQTIDATPAADGYVAIERTWQPGDRVEFELPLPVQAIAASDKIAATRGRTAFSRGPLIYNFESVDQDLTRPLGPVVPSLAATWTPDLLGGVIKLTGTTADGRPLQAVPNYARLNRGGRSMVWWER